MQISKYQEIYESIVKHCADQKIFINTEDAVKICKINNIELDSFPFPQDIIKYDRETHHTKEERDEASNKAKEIRLAYEQDTSDTTGNFNIFQLKYYNRKSAMFEIPLAEIAKNYFLSYQQNINNFRRGIKSLQPIAQMQVYEHVLKIVRDRLVEELTNTMDYSPDKYFDKYVDKRYFSYGENMMYNGEDLRRIQGEANEATKIIKTLKENEAKAVDNENIKEENYSDSTSNKYNNFSKQMFIDLVESQYKDKPIVKKALSVYAESQSDESLMSTIRTVFNDYANDSKRQQSTRLDFVGHRDFGFESAIHNLVR